MIYKFVLYVYYVYFSFFGFGGLFCVVFVCLHGCVSFVRFVMICQVATKCPVGEETPPTYER